jgi:hypothetical protein
MEKYEPGKNHDFHPLRMSKNVISPDAEVLKCYIKDIIK